MDLDEIERGVVVVGLRAGPVEIIDATQQGPDAKLLVFREASGGITEQLLFRFDTAGLSLTQPGPPWSFDADRARLPARRRGQRITLAGLFDPMLAVTTSDIEPLPHQISAVYGELLPRTPLRFLLADDPGAGKTIMAGLYIKELILRGDVTRCLIVAPGSLVEQWQDELYCKFGLRFEILTRA